MSGTERMFDAIRQGEAEEVARLIEAEPALASARRAGVSAALYAMYAGQRAIARQFVERGAALDVFDASGLGESGRLEDLLREDPSRANAVASDGFTPLGLAAFFGHPEAARLLLANGADPNLAAQNSTRVAPLHSAVAGESVEIVRELLARGADVHARQDLGFTALHGAAMEGSEEMIALLLAFGSDPAAKSDAGKTPADLAREKGRDRAARLLLLG